MPGIDKSRFINIGDIGDELLCEICLGVLLKPLVTQCCRHTYCSDCIIDRIAVRKTCPNCKERMTDKKLNIPPELLINLLKKLTAKCEFSDNGCNKHITYGHYKQHVKYCRYNPDANCKDCGEKNGERSEHNCVQLLCDKNESLKIEISNAKESNDEITEKLTEKIIIINSLKASFSRLTNVSHNYEKEAIKYQEELNDVLIQRNILIVENNRLGELNKKLSKKCNRFKTELLNAQKTSLENTKQSIKVKLETESKAFKNEKDMNLGATDKQFINPQKRSLNTTTILKSVKKERIDYGLDENIGKIDKYRDLVRNSKRIVEVNIDKPDQ